eukprot:TRINITY_DN67354_c0_g1_i1.p1 TRINITY_DN67354_c0_g1~~TRINITY_DN67354_c0_g1_i1.p1  ORF type:complete len:266 (-),score=52.96 TRINITY_DN67354_c0_g1_i1:162-959(-)
MQKNPPYQAWKDDKGKDGKAYQIGMAAFSTLSHALQEKFSRCLASAGDFGRFNRSLDALSVDEKTRETLLKEMKCESQSGPGIEKKVAKLFRKQINTLRSLGQKVVMLVIEETYPGTSEAAEAASKQYKNSLGLPSKGVRKRVRRQSKKRDDDGDGEKTSVETGIRRATEAVTACDPVDLPSANDNARSTASVVTSSSTAASTTGTAATIAEGVAPVPQAALASTATVDSASMDQICEDVDDGREAEATDRDGSLLAKRPRLASP